jgi:hypothetical protein
MAHDKDNQANEQETGFGTGLRRQLERRRLHEPYDGEPPVEEEVLEAEAEDAEEPGERSEEEGLRLELEAALAREARLRTALSENTQARERVEFLERELEAAHGELTVMREQEEARAGLSPRKFLREKVEGHVDALWIVFEQALDAVHSDGSPDFSTRLEAARALLSEAYDVPDENGELPDVQTARDELAGRRMRKAQQQP